VEPGRARPTRRQAESARRRERILEAARRCFGASGFAGATVEAIASEAGVSNGLLYQFFRSKDHLFEVVVDDLIRDWVRAMVGVGEDETAGEALEGMLRRSVAFCRSHPLLPALLTRDHLLELERTSDVASRRVRAHRAHVAALLRRGIEAGEFRPDLDVPAVADVVCQLQVDYSTRAYRGDPLHPAHPALIDAAARFIRDALRA
jgi:AcrR family transcriptional regulator